jgi:hypothetical protein
MNQKSIRKSIALIVVLVTVFVTLPIVLVLLGWSALLLCLDYLSR